MMTLQTALVIRHAQSTEDVNPSIHNLISDDEIKLTPLGIEQINNLGQYLSKYNTLNNRRNVIYLSPSKRAQETWIILERYLTGEKIIYTDHRIKNLNWGNINSENREQIEKERYKIGVLKYKFPGGDNTPDYVESINNFVKEIFYIYNCDKLEFPEHIIIITHGFALRVITRSIFIISDEKFKWFANPPNCYCAEIMYSAHKSLFVLSEPLPTINPIKH